MKLLIALACVLSQSAFAQEPYYPVPEGTSRIAYSCTTTETVSTKTEGGWSDWQPVETVDSFTRATWLGEVGFFTLDEGPNAVKFTHIVENAPEGNGVNTRLESVESWKRPASDWEKTSYSMDVTLLRREGAPLRRIEKRSGASLYWDISFTTTGANTTQVRRLLNASALNTADRKVSAHQQSCVY